MTPPRALQILRERIGLDPASLGGGVIDAAFADLMRARGATDADAFAREIAGQSDMFDELVDRLVVSETWFFRGSVFARLPERVRGRTGSPARFLTLPCSTGEEPYSVVMTLMEAGVPAAEWSVDAVDISGRAIAAARRGIYREFSFRQTDAAIRARYFEPTADGWQIAPTVRSGVRFHTGNVLRLDPSVVAGPFDLIFCRNLLIYLTPEARVRALDALEAMLADDGLLAVGPAEPSSLATRPFVAAGLDSDFLFRRSNARPQTAPAPAFVPKAIPARPAPMPAPPPVAAAPRPAWSDARRLADRGQLDAAFNACRRLLDQFGHAADGYSLLGVIEQARGNLDAADEAFRKALYLDPDHAESLTHGALVCDLRGQRERAATLRARLARIADPGGGS